MAGDRPYDVVLFGATGFTGGLVAEVLGERARGGALRIAVAGRSKAKLDALRARLARRRDAAVELDAIVADTGAPASLHRMAGQARVVLSTVGPYARHGEPVVEACVAEGADYVDITGEPPFVARTIERFDRPARERGLRLVSCCGFDSIPTDLGVQYTLEQLGAEGPVQVEGFVRTSGSFSGGTWHSALGILGDLGRADSGALDREPATSGRLVERAAARVARRPELAAWAVPMPTIDPQIVLRSARLLPAYGPVFRYAHYLELSSLPAVLAAGAGVGLLIGLARLRPTRELLLRLRDPGEGPGPEERARGHFRVRFVAEADGRRIVTEVRGGDPGYTETSKMVSEAALCLAQDRERLPARYGVLTPASAMGALLRGRIERAGIAFEVLERSEA